MNDNQAPVLIQGSIESGPLKRIFLSSFTLPGRLTCRLRINLDNKA
jgi:hypothetical protein